VNMNSSVLGVEIRAKSVQLFAASPYLLRPKRGWAIGFIGRRTITLAGKDNRAFPKVGAGFARARSFVVSRRLFGEVAAVTVSGGNRALHYTCGPSAMVTF
jgi:hypothetical protein